MTTELEICNTALLMANADEIQSFDDATREAKLCSRLYETTKDAIFSKFSWSFSLFQEALARTTNTPLFDFEYEYQLPTGFIRVLKTDVLGNEYRILKDKLFSDATTVELLYQKDPGPSFYPAYFRRVIELRMAELLSLSLVQDENMAERFATAYLIAMREARGTDSQNTPPLTISKNELRLTAVRGSDQ